MDCVSHSAFSEHFGCLLRQTGVQTSAFKTLQIELIIGFECTECLAVQYSHMYLLVFEVLM